ncbi:MAG: beta-N-acetylhexosaminidase [Pseudomonadota bacterium]
MGIGACILSVSGPTLTSNERRFLSASNPWGVILMGRSCADKAQVQTLIRDIQDATGRQTLIFIDQEGGRVARLKPPVWTKFPPAAVYGQLYTLDGERAIVACRLGHQLLGTELAELGIHANCAPVADLRQLDTHDSIGDRAFSTMANGVVDLGQAALEGLQASGVAGCLKHMPGQGRAKVDSHHDLPQITASIGDLEQDFGVFAALADSALMGMTGHVCFEAIDPDQAATVSPDVISDIIRGRIGFDGLLMTDDLGMEALGGSLSDRGARAIDAGCDVLLHCSGFLKDETEILNEMSEVADVAGQLSGAAAVQAQAVEASIRPALTFDREAAWAEYITLMEPVMTAGASA